MRNMSDNEVLGRAAQLKKRHRSEWCQLVYEASVGRSIKQVSTLLGHTGNWVTEHLDWYALESAVGGGRGADPTVGIKRDDVREVMKSHAPSEPDPEYVEEYEAEGHTPEVAKRLAFSSHKTRGMESPLLLNSPGIPDRYRA